MGGMAFATRAPFVLGVVIALASGRASADEDPKSECLRAFEAAQRARLKSELVEARRELRICSQESCPALVQGPCTGWLREVEAAMPSVVVSVRTAEGDDVHDARVSIDGRPVRATGTPLELSPGEHKIRVQAGKRTLERTIIVNAGEKSRLVQLTMPLAPGKQREPVKDRKPATSEASPSWPYLVGALGIVLVGAGVTLDVIGSRRLGELRDDCAPNCTESDVSGTKTKIIVGDSLIAGGVIAIGIATYGLISGSGEAGVTSATR